MNIYFGIKYHPDMSNRGLIERILGALEAAGHQTFCVVRDLEKWGEKTYPLPELMNATFDLIERCDWVLLEVSEKGIGLGIEAGYARAKGIPILAIAQPNIAFSPTLRGIAQALSYQNPNQIADFFNEIGAAHADVPA